VKGHAPARLARAVARRVAELREARGLTQQEFADVLKVTLRYAQSLESGTQNLTLGSLEKLSAALRVPITALFEAPEGSQPKPGRPKRRM